MADPIDLSNKKLDLDAAALVAATNASLLAELIAGIAPETTTHPCATIVSGCSCAWLPTTLLCSCLSG